MISPRSRLPKSLPLFLSYYSDEPGTAYFDGLGGGGAGGGGGSVGRGGFPKLLRSLELMNRRRIRFFGANSLCLNSIRVISSNRLARANARSAALSEDGSYESSTASTLTLAHSFDTYAAIVAFLENLEKYPTQCRQQLRK